MAANEAAKSSVLQHSFLLYRNNRKICTFVVRHAVTFTEHLQMLLLCKTINKQYTVQYTACHKILP